MSVFSNRLRCLRLERNLSQRQLSKITDISHSAICAYENEKREPSFESLEALCDVFNCDIDYILGRTDVRNASAQGQDWHSNLNIQLFAENSPEEHRLTEGERLWLELYRRVSPDTRNLLIKLVDSFDGISEEKQKLALQLIRVAFGDLE